MSERLLGVDSYFPDGKYSLLPFRFTPLDDKYLISNDFGEWLVVDKDDLFKLIKKEIRVNDKLFMKLIYKNFISSSDFAINVDLLASKYKTKKLFIEDFSKLHIFVLTIRCNHSCIYCQVSRKSESASKYIYDMSDDVLSASIQLMSEVPSNHVTMEFQGGESSLSMDLVKKAVLLSQKMNKKQNKDISYVICTNLSNITDDDFLFFKKYKISISTSIDGPEYVHNSNRTCSKFNSYQIAVSQIKKARAFLGFDSVSALMTTTKFSLDKYKEIIDEYVKQDFKSLFIRELNPYGFAHKAKKIIGYTTDEFIRFYEDCLGYILQLNKSGTSFSECYATIILRKLLTPYSTGFVDLQSPTGTGFGVTLYNYDGNVYPSDESRMLAESGDSFFKMGNVLENTYEEIFFGDTMQLIASAAVNDCLPQCSDCAYAPFCGAEPVRHYQTQGDVIGNRVNDSFCKKNKAIIKIIINYLEHGSKEDKEILLGWINK